MSVWCAGVGWRNDRFGVVVLDHDGKVAVPETTFATGDIALLVGLLRRAQDRSGHRLVSVIDSISGVLERYLLEDGLDVYRADPWLFAAQAHGGPPRPDGGSVSAADLANAAMTNLYALSRLTFVDGGMSGRDDEVRQAKLDAAGVEGTLIDTGRLVINGAGAAREVALTFDDGPHPDHTLKILDVLRDYEATATFFCVGMQVRAFPSVLERIATDGHEIGNHTWSHPYLPDLTRAELEEQIDQTSIALAAVTGQRPSLVRPPYGGRSAEVLEWLAEAGMTTALWDVEADDWAMPGAAAIEADVVNQTAPGSVVLLHDGGGDRSQTVAALPPILEYLRGQEYEFVPIRRFVPVPRQAPPVS